MAAADNRPLAQPDDDPWGLAEHAPPVPTRRSVHAPATLSGADVPEWRQPSDRGRDGDRGSPPAPPVAGARRWRGRDGLVAVVSLVAVIVVWWSGSVRRPSPSVTAPATTRSAPAAVGTGSDGATPTSSSARSVTPDAPAASPARAMVPRRRTGNVSRSPVIVPPRATPLTGIAAAAPAPSSATPPVSSPRGPLAPTAPVPPTASPTTPSERAAAATAGDSAPLDTPAAATSNVDIDPLPSARASITSTLDAYRRSYNTLDAVAVSTIWQGLDIRGLQRAFATLASQEMAFETCDVQINGDAAQAVCLGVLHYVPKVGGSGAQARRLSWTFDLERRGDRWLIDRLTAQ